MSESIEIEIYCEICHSLVPENCNCPECTVCGAAGDPSCINTHMPWEKWPHFRGIDAQIIREMAGPVGATEPSHFDGYW